MNQARRGSSARGGPLSGPSTHVPTAADYRSYRVQRAKKERLLDFIVGALEQDKCRILRHSEPDTAPFRVTFETPGAERLGIVAYAFFANAKITKNRPVDEHRFQVKYGPDDKKTHVLWQDPYMLYTTLFCGIDPERGLFVGADPSLHSPTKFFISIEYKEEHVHAIQQAGWHVWERDHRLTDSSPVEVLVGGTSHSFLRYVRFEREALGEDQGHRQLLAEQLSRPQFRQLIPGLTPEGMPIPAPARLHALAQEFRLAESEVLDLIASARRLKMAVRGWVAEEHLARQLVKTPGVTECRRSDEEGSPDITLQYRGHRLTVECKNVLRKTTPQGIPRLDFQRTRASKGDPSSRYYSPDEFDIVAACLHAVTERWEYRYTLPRCMERHATFRRKLANNVKVDDRWTDQAEVALGAATGASVMGKP